MGRLQAPGGVNAEASSREDRLWEWACNPGRAGRSRQGRLCRERVGGIAGGLAQAQAGVPAGGPGHHAWDICPEGGGVLTSRAQHLEQLEVLHAHLLLMPRQVGCRHRGRMSPAVHYPSLWPPQPSPHPAAPGGPCPTFRDPQLHSTALVFVLVPHGEWVAGARGSAPGGAGYMAAPTGAGASWCRLRADSGASAAS